MLKAFAFGIGTILTLTLLNHLLLNNLDIQPEGEW